MRRHFLSDFVLPLLKGGELHLGRPVGWPDLSKLQARLARDSPGAMAETGSARRSRNAGRHGNSLRASLSDGLAASEVVRHRQLFVAAILPVVEPQPLDQADLRLLAAAHNLLVLGHPELKGRARVAERVAELTRGLADLGPPESEPEAASRYALLAHLPDAVRVDHQVLVGPAWMRVRLKKQGGALGLPLRTVARLPSAAVHVGRHAWLKEIGVPACAHAALETLFRACPVLEAMDPMRLHPTLSWRRILPVLRFPSLSRAIANRVLALGIEAAGSALAGALLRFASVGEGSLPLASAHEAALGIRFIAHTFWLDHLWGGACELDVACDLAALLVAAADVEPSLLWPPDIRRDDGAGARFAQALQRLQVETPMRVPDRHRAMRSLCELAHSDQMVSPVTAGRGEVGAPVRR